MSRRKKLRRRQLDARLSQVAELGLRQPPGGWIKTIRTTLGMTLQELGQRIGVTRQTVQDLEVSEASGRISLEKLRRAADALDCDVRVYLVPRTSLDDFVTQRAKEVARRRIEKADRSMQLEKQGLTEQQKSELIDDLAAELLASGKSGLWKDEV